MSTMLGAVETSSRRSRRVRFSVHNQCKGENSPYEAIYRRPGLFANVWCMREEFRARWLDYYR
jgi:hypothetical protein